MLLRETQGAVRHKFRQTQPAPPSTYGKLFLQHSSAVDLRCVPMIEEARMETFSVLVALGLLAIFARVLLK
jgi:hypothetical protein